MHAGSCLQGPGLPRATGPTTCCAHVNTGRNCSREWGRLRPKHRREGHSCLSRWWRTCCPAFVFNADHQGLWGTSRTGAPRSTHGLPPHYMGLDTSSWKAPFAQPRHGLRWKTWCRCCLGSRHLLMVPCGASSPPWGASLSPGCSTSHPAPCCGLRKAEDGPGGWEPAPAWRPRRNSWLLAAQPWLLRSSGGVKQPTGHPSLHLSFSLCNSAFKKNVNMSRRHRASWKTAPVLRKGPGWGQP